MDILLAVHILISVCLIVLILIQTQKEQGVMGLFGQGSSSSSSQRGLGSEESLKVWTKRVAVLFVFSSLLMAFLQPLS